MKKIVLLLVPVLFTLTACLPSLQTMRSWEQIEVMKGGHLIVFLDNEQEKITKLREFGYETRADKLAEKELKQHLRIIEAFQRNFAFCPVYFTLDNEEEYFVFLNEDAVPDISIQPEKSQAFFGRFEPRDLQDYQDEVKQVFVFQLFDPENQRLESPFPGYEEVAGYPVSLSMGYAVKALNDRLDNYHSKPRGKR